MHLFDWQHRDCLVKGVMYGLLGRYNFRGAQPPSRSKFQFESPFITLQYEFHNSSLAISFRKWSPVSLLANEMWKCEMVFTLMTQSLQGVTLIPTLILILFLTLFPIHTTTAQPTPLLVHSLLFNAITLFSGPPPIPHLPFHTTLVADYPSW